MTSSPAVNGGASYKGSLASREVSGLEDRKRRLSGLPTRRAVSCGGVTTAPILRRVIAFRFPRNALSPRVNATCNVRTCVNICLILRDPTLRIRTLELGLRPTTTDVTTGVARLGRVARVHELDRDAGFEGLVLNPVGESGKRPRVQTPIHVLSVIQILTDVRQVLECDHGVVEGRSVLDGFSRRLLNNIRQRVLVVVETFVHSPLLSVTLLEALQGRVHFLPECPRTSAVVDVRLDRSVVLTGTARQQFRLADIEANSSRVVRDLWLGYLILDGDVQHPIGSVLLQSELADHHVLVEQVEPERFLFGVDPKRNPEGVATPGLRDAPAELVPSIVGVVESESAVRESNRVIVFDLRRVVRIPKLRDVVLERVLRVGRESVGRDDVVDRRLCVRATLKGVRKGTAVGRHGTLEPLLFASGGRSKCGFERFRGGSSGDHSTVQTIRPVHINYTDTINMCEQVNPLRGRRRTVRAVERDQRQARLHLEGADARRRGSVGHRGGIAGRVETRTNAIPPRPKGRGFLATAR